MLILSLQVGKSACSQRPNQRCTSCARVSKHRISKCRMTHFEKLTADGFKTTVIEDRQTEVRSYEIDIYPDAMEATTNANSDYKLGKKEESD